MKAKYKQGDDLELEFRFFFNNLTTGEVFETNNEPMAWQKFNECAHPCELWDDGNIIGDKEFEDDPILDVVTLVDQLYTGDEYVDIDEEEMIEI